MKDNFTNQVYSAWCAGRCGGGTHLPYANILLASALDKNVADGSQSQLRVDDDTTRATIQKEFDEFEALYQKEVDETQVKIDAIATAIGDLKTALTEKIDANTAAIVALQGVTQKEFDDTQTELHEMHMTQDDIHTELVQAVDALLKLVNVSNDPKSIVKTLPNTMTTGGTQKATAVVTLRDGETVSSADKPDDFMWYSDNQDVISIAADGTLTAKKAGTAKVSVSYKGLLESDSATITVTDVAVTVVTVAPATASVAVGQTANLTATVAPANATNKAVTWTTSDATKATVANGVVTGVAAGTATITATSSADATKKASSTVTVTTPEGA